MTDGHKCEICAGNTATIFDTLCNTCQHAVITTECFDYETQALQYALACAKAWRIKAEKLLQEATQPKIKSSKFRRKNEPF